MKRLIPRSFERKQLIGEATLQTMPQGEPLTGRVFNLAQSGLALFASRSLPTGQLVEVQFRVSGKLATSGHDKRDGRVVRCRALVDGNILGISFVRPLEADELKLLEVNWVRS